MSSPTIPRSTVVLRCVRSTSVRGGFLVDAGQFAQVDAEDGGTLIAVGDFAPAPAGSRPDVIAHNLPEELAPPDRVRMRWVSGNSTRQYNGVSVSLGDVFEVDPSTAAGLEHDQVAERIDA